MHSLLAAMEKDNFSRPEVFYNYMILVFYPVLVKGIRWDFILWDPKYKL